MEHNRADRQAIRVLVADDERPIRFLMEREMPRAGCLVTAVEGGEQALAALAQQPFDVALLDLKMPGMGGMEALRRIRAAGFGVEVVILTGHPDVATAIEAMKLGAYDYLTKPFKLAEVEVVLRRAAERKHLRRESGASLADAPRPAAEPAGPPIILGQSSAMAALLATVERVAPTTASVLIEGESGSGKGLLAQAIHRRSGRAAHPLLAINCSGFQDQLLESELFGHEKGAFTGAAAAKAGLFEVAGGGTLFLDEVAEMSPAMQAKLLHALDTREFRRVGGTRTLVADARIVAATNKRLEHEVRAGRFREDLYYRLNVVHLTVPPLRQRREDIPPLVEHFLQRFRQAGQPAKTVTPEALAELMHYPWPGNVRELSNIIERLTILVPGDVIRPDDLPFSHRAPMPVSPEAPGEPRSLAEMERQHIARILAETGGKKMQAARLLGIDLKTLNKKIKDYAIRLPGRER
jgi:DNA-binding NtrC family response regulator